MDGEGRPANRVYYLELGPGLWRGAFRFRVTSWRRLLRARVGAWNRIVAATLSLLTRLLGPCRVVARIEAFPSRPPAGVATNDLAISKFRVPLYRIREEYRLDPDGTRIAVVARERTGPLAPWRRREYSARVTAGGLAATYQLPLLGDQWTAHYDVEPDGGRIRSRLTCPWAEAAQDMDRVAS